jgi:hypothetical protein
MVRHRACLEDRRNAGVIHFCDDGSEPLSVLFPHFKDAVQIGSEASISGVPDCTDNILLWRGEDASRL